jgi:hypothetical protein
MTGYRNIKSSLDLHLLDRVRNHDKVYPWRYSNGTTVVMTSCTAMAVAARHYASAS